MALTKIKTGGIADNAITNAKMADDAIDSADFADGSIDNVHLAGSIAVSKTLLAGGTGLTLSTNTLAVDAAQTQITSVGTIGTGVWNGTAVASAYLDADTAHLSTTQTFSGAKTFSDEVTLAFAKQLRWNTHGGNTDSRSWGMGAGVVGGSGNADYFGISRSNADDNTLDTNVLVINKDGKIGIGTTSPASSLEIEVDAATHLKLRRNATHFWDIQVGSNGYLSFQKNGATDDLVFDASSNATFGGKISTTSTSAPQFSIGTTSLLELGHYYLAVQNNNEFIFKTSSSGVATESGRFTPSGNFQVGHAGTNQTAKLAVDGNATFAGTISVPDGSVTAPSITNTGDTNTGFYFNGANEISIALDGTQQWRYSGQQMGAGYGANPGYPAYSFATDWNTGMYRKDADVLAFSTGGTERLSISDSVNIESDASGWASIITSTNASPYVIKWVTSAHPNNETNMFLQCDGNSNDNKFKIWSNGELWQETGGSTINSDRKLKDNIVDASSKLDDINKLKVRNFNYKKTPDIKRIGFIAQEVEEIFPSLVKEHPYTSEIEDDEGNIITPSEWSKNIQQVAFIPMLIKAFQELSAKLDTANAKITALENA